MALTLKEFTVPNFGGSINQAFNSTMQAMRYSNDALNQSIQNLENKRRQEAGRQFITESILNPTATPEQIMDSIDLPSRYVSPEVVAAGQRAAIQQWDYDHTRAMDQSKLIASPLNTQIRAAYETGNLGELYNIYRGIPEREDIKNGTLRDEHIRYLSPWDLQRNQIALEGARAQNEGTRLRNQGLKQQLGQKEKDKRQ